ncbi:hypothetical protein DCO58_05520 [Helicobacter saguini]|uniref:Uncharacterized protein n=1 Tax=Helicobacter saguini TaxID=1548018 RepID=A0A347VT93_9HELI|nr:hypothetical protein [Helicobacter saguini]MWV62190.1 hypothetical protein [Helicobacter saguini]MWV67136.1 hypothetical protein [Helicobacter saguini]MWV69488.1 hypothetical protein [Helicobacter saguini]MWV70960.1 hypothetical protein [Helicobacter saguini]TLD92952.1 hypothetical protein LS64_009700 [Helicobacter saguini]
MSRYTKEQILKLLKYAELAWASYSTKLNNGMFGENDKKWGLNKQKKYFNKEEAKQNNQVAYKQALTNELLVFMMILEWILQTNKLQYLLIVIK